MLTTQLSEEAVEVSQMCSKILRFGWFETRKGLTENNQERLIDEINDLMGVVNMLQRSGVLPGNDPRDIISPDKIDSKVEKIKKYMRYSAQCGTLDSLSEIPD